jgi:hypothetical protein
MPAPADRPEPPTDAADPEESALAQVYALARLRGRELRAAVATVHPPAPHRPGSTPKPPRKQTHAPAP